MKVCVPTMGNTGLDEAICQHFNTFSGIQFDPDLVELFIQKVLNEK